MNANVLIVDDSAMKAVDGVDALEKLSPDTKRIVCNVNMPRMNGMLPTEGHADLIQKAKDLGANGWIVKPLKPELLVNAAKKLVG